MSFIFFKKCIVKISPTKHTSNIIHFSFDQQGFRTFLIIRSKRWLLLSYYDYRIIIKVYGMKNKFVKNHDILAVKLFMYMNITLLAVNIPLLHQYPTFIFLGNDLCRYSKCDYALTNFVFPCI